MFRNRALIILSHSLTFCLLFTLFVSDSKAQVSPNDAVYGRFMSGVLGYSTGVNLNSVADTTISIKASKYIIRKITVTNCSTTPVLAQIAFYTAAAAGGTNFVAATVLTTLSATTTFIDLTIINVTTTALTASSLFARNTVVQGSALTCDVYIFGDVLP